MKALEAINDDCYNYPIENLALVIQELIEDYLIRENGRLGKIVEEEYINF